MKTLKRISPLPLTILVVLLIGLGMGIMSRTSTRAQSASTSSWSDTDIGLAPIAGNAQSDASGNIALTSSGADILGTNDAFNFFYQSLGTNGQLVAQVTSIQGTNAWIKAGLMLRETLGAGSRNAMMTATLNGQTWFQCRTLAGGETRQDLGSTNQPAPCWLKIVRNGNWVGGYSSTDGANWTLVSWENFPGLAQEVYVGLAVTAHNSEGNLASGVFNQVTVGSPELSQATLPVVGSGDGLSGAYFANAHLFGNASTNRLDSRINFDWRPMTQLKQQLKGVANGSNTFAMACMSTLGMSKFDEFSIRWNGEVEAQFTEPYTIYAAGDDGVRVWLDEQLLIDDWAVHPSREDSATVNLVAGRHYLLRVEYYQNHMNAKVKLLWSSPSTSKRVVPQTQLYSQPAMDPNGSGLPVRWEQIYFGQTGIDPSADADGDGLSNLQEWYHHTNPTNTLTYGFPDQWMHGDIQRTGGNSRGDSTYTNGVFTVSSRGHDIWGNGDDFHYVFQPIGTNGQIIAQVTGFDGTNGFAKAGVMLRENLDHDSRNVMLTTRAKGGLESQCRLVTGGDSTRTPWSTNTWPGWLKLARNGDWIGEYYSADGTNWTLFDWQTLNQLSPQAFVGLAITACNYTWKGGAETVTFEQVSVGPADLSQIVNPMLGTGDGLLANYRNDSLLYLPGQTNRVDSQVNLHWVHLNQVISGLNPDSYGVCWSGEVQAQFTEPYTFSVMTRAEDWVRVWVNDQLVVDQWRKLHPDGDYAGTPVNLVAGQHYLVRVEMFNNHGHGVAALNWSSPSTPERLVPPSQLYSQPAMDPDGSGLPVLWEQAHFAATGVDPNADPDGDGLSNMQEYQYHTDPNKMDTDGDGLPDPWEIAHGLDPQYPGDAGLDYNNSGISNLQDYQLGLNPLNTDSNGDGLPDAFEAQYLNTGASLNCTNQITTAVTVNGSQAVNYLGSWQVDGNDIYCLGRRGGVDYSLTFSNADKYVLNLIGTQNQPNPMETSFKLLLGVDGQTLGHYTLNGGYGTNGVVELVLPYLQAGSHVLHVFWDGVASYSSLRIKQVKLLSVSDQTNQVGLKNWVVRMISDESGLDITNSIIASYISPICLEGRDPYPAMMSVTNHQTNVLSSTATSDGRWYAMAHLQAGVDTLFQVGYQNGAQSETRQLQWLPVSFLSSSNLVVREGDSLLFNVAPANGSKGSLQIVIGTNTYTGQTSKGAMVKFASSGIYSVSGTYTPSSGSPQTGSLIVTVLAQSELPNGQPAAWTGMERYLNLPNLATGVVLQADSRLTCYFNGTNGNGVTQLALGADANEPRSILARSGAGGSVVDSTQVQGFDIWSGDQAYTKILQKYPDGSQLVEMLVISSPVNTNVTFTLQPIVSGVMFDDGTILKTLTATNFDVLGQCPVRFIRPASATTSVCNSIKAWQGNYQIGYRH